MVSLGHNELILEVPVWQYTLTHHPTPSTCIIEYKGRYYLVKVSLDDHDFNYLFIDQTILFNIPYEIWWNIIFRMFNKLSRDDHICTENQELSWCQLCHHWCHCRLSLLKTKSCHDANFVITGVTAGCHYWKPRVVMMPTLSSLVSLQVVIIENQELSWCQLCHHWCHCRLSLLKTKSCHDANFVITGVTAGCHYWKPRVVMMPTFMTTIGFQR